MTLTVHVLLINDNFSPEYAEANFGGEESESNPLYDWEDEFEVKELKSFNLLRKAKMPLAGEMPNGEPFFVEVEKMCLIELISEVGNQGFVGVSESILENVELSENKVTFYIKDYEPHSNPIPGVYIASKEFPKELIF
jgi:hypothetical protein